MASSARKLQSVGPTVEDELNRMDKQRSANLRIWEPLSKTDPAHTKGFKRAGGFQGTAIKPIWVERRLTEMFGPCGIGWGIDEPSFRLVEAGDELLVYCTVAGWYVENGHKATVYGVGGDKVLSKNKYGLSTDDEAFKKACTDATGNAFKHVGVGADVHMGLFEDSKYLAEVNAEFHPPKNDNADKAHKDDPFPQGPGKNLTNLKELGRAFWRDVEACGDGDELECLLADKNSQLLVKQIMAALPRWWDGGTDKNGEVFEGLEEVIARKRRDFEALEAMQ